MEVPQAAGSAIAWSLPAASTGKARPASGHTHNKHKHKHARTQEHSAIACGAVHYHLLCCKDSLSDGESHDRECLQKTGGWAALVKVLAPDLAIEPLQRTRCAGDNCIGTIVGSGHCVCYK